MDITARCKFRVNKLEPVMAGDGETLQSVNVLMSAEYDETNPEDKAFAEATPSGTLDMNISNPALFEVFQPGLRFYLNLEAVAPDGGSGDGNPGGDDTKTE